MEVAWNSRIAAELLEIFGIDRTIKMDESQRGRLLRQDDHSHGLGANGFDVDLHVLLLRFVIDFHHM